MQDEKFDLNELVNTLLREREENNRAVPDEPAVVTLVEADTDIETDSEAVSKVPEEDKSVIEDLPPVDAEPAVKEPASVEMPKTPKKKKGSFLSHLFHQKDEVPEEDPEESWADWGLKPIGHYHIDEETPEAEKQEPENNAEISQEGVENVAEGEEEFPAVQVVDETITMPVVLPSGAPADGLTRVVDISAPINNATPAPIAEESPAVDDQLPDQLSLEEMVRVEDMEEPPEGMDEDPAERLQHTRLEKIREFTINGEDEEPNEPDEEAEETPEDEPELSDFTNYQDAKAILLELHYRHRSALLTLIASSVLEAIMLLLTLFTVFTGQSPVTDAGYLAVQLFCLGLMLIINYSAVSRGLSGLFMLSANSDTGPAVTGIITLIGVALHFIKSGMILPIWAPVAGLLLTLNALARHIKEKRILNNFTFVSYQGEKYSARVIEDEKALHEIGRRAAVEGDATVGYFRRTNFLTDYIANAYEDDLSDKWAKWFTPITFGIAILVSIILMLAQQIDGFWNWMQVFVGMLCLTTPVCSLALQLPLSRSCRRMLARGGFLVGWKAVGQFGKPDALAVDVSELYPDESMLLHGIKTFSGTHIDDAILDAASLSIRSGGPLSLIFRRIIENKEELLHDVDSLVYEQGMGLSGWVNGRRVLVGNRRLLQNHGVDVPSADYEARYAKDGRRLVYLSTAGELSAMFVVTYLPDEDIKEALQGLCRSRVTLLIRSCDPNITAEMLCEDFQLDEYYIDILPAVAGRLFVQLTEGAEEASPAVLASNGHILGTAYALSSCRNLGISTKMALIAQAVIAAIGLVMSILWTASGSVLLFLGSSALVAVSTFVSWLLPLIKHT